MSRPQHSNHNTTDGKHKYQTLPSTTTQQTMSANHINSSSKVAASTTSHADVDGGGTEMSSLDQLEQQQQHQQHRNNEYNTPVRRDSIRTDDGQQQAHIAAKPVAALQDKMQWTIKWRLVLVAFLLLFLFLALGSVLFPDNHHAGNCAALIICVAALWVTEAIPFFAAALLIPLLAVPLNVLPEAVAANHKEAANLILGKTFGSTQVLVLGGLCLGKALAKHKLEQVVSKYCLAPIAHRPKLFVLVLMLISTIACAFLSNVAAPLLILNVIQPTLWNMDREKGGPQAILLCLAIAGNLGGMASPNASPQNAVALAALQDEPISYVMWILGALPLVLIQMVIGWLLVLQIWKPFPDDYVIPVAGTDDDDDVAQAAAAPQQTAQHSNNDNTQHDPHFMHAPPTARFSEQHTASIAPEQTAAAEPVLAEHLLSARVERAVVLATTFVTIVLWCVPSEGTFGNAGVVALVPIVVFFGIGVLAKEDFNSLSWHLLFLLAGGNMIGLVAKDSNLLEEIVAALKPFLTTNPPFTVVAVLVITVALIACPLSHTVTALVLMPVIVHIAKVTPELPSEKALVFNTVLMASGSMLLPVSSFPNIQSLLCEDADGKPYLLAKDFLLPGGVMTLLSVAQLTTYYTPFAMWMFPRIF